MKFNWKANWEILLVLVIIVIGIVITTIAAIRNKDKHLPYLTGTEEGDFGQVYSAGAGNAILADGARDDGAPANQGHQQEDYHRHSTPGSGAPMRKAQSQPMGGADARVASPAKAANGAPARTQQVGKQADVGAGADPSPVSTSSAFSDLHEPPTTTDAALLLSPAGHRGPAHQHLSASNKRHADTNTQAPYLGRLVGQDVVATGGSRDKAPHEHRPISADSEPLDDTHTTRSSLAPSKSDSHSNASQQYQPGDHQSVTPTLAFHGPYGNFLSAVAASNGDSDSQMPGGGGGGGGASGLPGITRPSFPVRANETRNLDLYNQANLTRPQQYPGASDPVMNQQLANLVLQQQEPSLPDDPVLQTSAGPFRGSVGVVSGAGGAGYTGSLPISLLLGDLLKLTQPNFGSSAAGPADDSQPGHLQTRYHRGILQQIRSLPGPLISLIGQSLQSSNQAQLLPNGERSLASNNNNNNNNNFNHEASESNQNYDYRLSMSPVDIHSIFARSLGATALDTLPAFPPPKGIPQPWVPPTSGGSLNHSEAQSSESADFVATNTAGFVRAFQQQQQGSDLSLQPFPAMDSPFGAAGQQPPPSHQQQQQQQQQQSQQVDAASQVQQQQQQRQQASSQNALPANPYQPYAGSQLQEHLGPANQVHLYANQQQQQFAQQPSFNHAPVGYHSGSSDRGSSGGDMAVPLGFNPPQLQQRPQLQLQVQRQPSMDFGKQLAGLESSPKFSVASAGQQQPQQQQQQPFGRQPIMLNSIHAGQRQSQAVGAPSSSKPGRRRRKRALTGSEQEPESDTIEARASGYSYEEKEKDNANANDDDPDDSYPLSVVSPDGRPLSSRRFRGLARAREQQSDSQVAQSSQRASSHANRQVGSGAERAGARAKPRAAHLRAARYRLVGSREQWDGRQGSRTLKGKRPGKRHWSGPRAGPGPGKGQQAMEMTSGSDLMGKLLGTASNNDESEMDIDMDDDDDADNNNERRKEELDDAEFGIVNDQPQADPGNGGVGGGGGGDSTGSELSQPMESPKSSLVDEDGTRSGSGESSTYSQRRNHQPTRSDIEFYGHPGEETRQLKYGILGSGNYEVVNGGIYPEADESTAAVNSVANYVRKPGGLLAGLPKVLGGSGANSHQLAADFMPGTRIGGFLRGSASSALAANPHDVAHLAAALMPLPGGKSDDLTGPLLDLIDANNGHYLSDPTLINQLSSGSSSRTSHASKDGEDTERDFKNSSPRQRHKKYKGRHGKPTSQADDIQVEAEPLNQQLQQQQSSISGERRAPSSSKTGNQFNKYQILPSKKVTIYSDQDLDSAPSDQRPQQQSVDGRRGEQLAIRLSPD